MSDLTIRIGYPQNIANPLGYPLPTQEKFHNCYAKYRLLAGGFGSGKTTSLAIEILKEIFSYDKNYGVLGRKDLGELKSTTLKELLDLCPEKLIVNHNKADHVIKFINGSELFYMNLDDARSAVEKIKSLNLGFVAIDQLEEISEAVFYAFQGRLRRQESSRNFFATCNPAGHDWLWTKWKNAPPSLEYQLFEAITTENIYLPQDYVKELLAYPEKWVKRYVFCSWDDFEGIVYSEFVEKKHVIAPYSPADNERHIHTLDYGFRNPTAILYAATDFDGITRVYDEYYQSGRLISEISESYKLNKFWKRAYRQADPSIHNVQRDGKNIYDEFLLNKIHWNRADNDISQGINRVNELFKSGKLLVCQNCVNFMSEIGNYKWKEIKPGQERNDYEEPTKHNDHLMDTTRYLANYIQLPYKPMPPEPKITGREYVEVGSQTKETTF